MLAFYISLVDDQEQQRVLETVYNNYKKQMLCIAMSVLKSKEDAEDAVHNVFLTIAQRQMDTVCQITNAVDLRNYLLKATKNVCLNMLRSRKKITDLPETELCALGKTRAVPSDEDFWQLICSRAEAEQVTKAIQKLPDIYRWALYYHFVLELTVPQMARASDLKTKAVETRLYRGKKLLLEALDTTGGDDQ